MKEYEKISKFIDNTADLFPASILSNLKKKQSLRIIKEIIRKSNKEISEAVFILLTVIKYTFKSGDAFVKLQESDSFEKYIKDNKELILRLAIEKSVQGNIPERALPILEILYKMTDHSPINVIELGASYGLIGRLLLNPGEILDKRERYFSLRQKIPENHSGIDHYLGIELDPPDKEFLIASIWGQLNENYEELIINFLNDIQTDTRFKLIKGDAFGFSDLEAVNNFTAKPGKIVVLTSFMLYQFEDKKKKLLVDEILEFARRVDGHWINQAVNIALDSGENEYYIEWDGKKIIQLFNDTCLDWRWIK